MADNFFFFFFFTLSGIFFTLPASVILEISSIYMGARVGVLDHPGRRPYNVEVKGMMQDQTLVGVSQQPSPTFCRKVCPL